MQRSSRLGVKALLSVTFPRTSCCSKLLPSHPSIPLFAIWRLCLPSSVSSSSNLVLGWLELIYPENLKDYGREQAFPLSIRCSPEVRDLLVLVFATAMITYRKLHVKTIEKLNLEQKQFASYNLYKQSQDIADAELVQAWMSKHTPSPAWYLSHGQDLSKAGPTCVPNLSGNVRDCHFCISMMPSSASNCGFHSLLLTWLLAATFPTGYKQFSSSGGINQC